MSQFCRKNYFYLSISESDKNIICCYMNKCKTDKTFIVDLTVDYDKSVKLTRIYGITIRFQQGLIRNYYVQHPRKYLHRLIMNFSKVVSMSDDATIVHIESKIIKTCPILKYIASIRFCHYSASL